MALFRSYFCFSKKNLFHTHSMCSKYILQTPNYSVSAVRLRTCCKFSNSFSANSCKHVIVYRWHISRSQVWNSSLARTIHTSSPQRALPPVIFILLRPIAKVAAVVFGRTVRWWWRSLPQSRKDQLTHSLKRYRLFALACLGPASAGGIYFYTSHLEEDPITKRVKFIIFSPDQMKQIADVTQQSIGTEYKEFILPPSHPLYQRVVRVLIRLLKANLDIPSTTNYEWRVVLVDKPDVKNSVVLPNGSIFVFTGMLSVCSNDDQLGIILSHEISHALLHHAAEQMSNIHLIELLLFIPLLAVWAVIPSLGALLIHYLSDKFSELLIHLPFSRSTEMEADELGLMLAAKACFDVREASAFWCKMRIISNESSEENLEWLSTHPSFETRQQFLEDLMPSAIEVRDCSKCPKLPLIDPRRLVAALQNPPDRENRSGRKIAID